MHKIYQVFQVYVRGTKIYHCRFKHNFETRGAGLKGLRIDTSGGGVNLGAPLNKVVRGCSLG